MTFENIPLVEVFIQKASFKAAWLYCAFYPEAPINLTKEDLFNWFVQSSPNGAKMIYGLEPPLVSDFKPKFLLSFSLEKINDNTGILSVLLERDNTQRH